MNRINLVQRFLHRWRARDSPIDPNRKENGIHSALAHARNVDVAIQVAFAQIEAFREQPLRGVVVGVQHNRGKVQFAGSIANRIRGAPAV
jgi:hypothetical protein